MWTVRIVGSVLVATAAILFLGTAGAQEESPTPSPTPSPTAPATATPTPAATVIIDCPGGPAVPGSPCPTATPAAGGFPDTGAAAGSSRGIGLGWLALMALITLGSAIIGAAWLMGVREPPR